MQSKISNLDGIIDQSLKTASIFISVVAFPATIIAGYRNLFVDFLPFHQIFVTLCYVLFVFVAFGQTKSKQFRLYATVIIYFLLFLLAGIRNSSIIFVAWVFSIGMNVSSCSQRVFNSSVFLQKPLASPAKKATPSAVVSVVIGRMTFVFRRFA